MKNRVLLILSLIFVTSSIVLAQTARKTITNFDLEKYRQKREKAEADYRENYKKLGMPSPEELEQREEENRVKREDLSQRLANERLQTAGYYAEQANELRAEIIDVNAQINYLRNLIGNLPVQNSIFVSPEQVFAVAVAPYGRGIGNRPRNRAITQAPNVQAARNAAAAMPNPYVGTPLYRTGIKARIPANRVRGGRYFGGYSPSAVDNGSYEREELISRLRSLEQARAGLMAQWNLLAEKARQAGAKID